MWNHYGGSLVSVVKTHTQSLSAHTTEWMDKVIGSPLSDACLLYRYYLVHEAFVQDIYLDVNFPPLYHFMGSTLTSDPVFSYLPDLPCWMGIEHDPYAINRLRADQICAHTYLQQLFAYHDEIVDVKYDHGLLFSLSLLYGLHLAQVIIVYEVSVNPHPALLDVHDHLCRSLSHLKGAICHGPNHRHQANV